MTLHTNIRKDDNEDESDIYSRDEPTNRDSQLESSKQFVEGQLKIDPDPRHLINIYGD